MPVRCDGVRPAPVADHLELDDRDLLAEARHRSTGRRGPAVPAEEPADRDLTTDVVQAAVVGARVIAAAGDRYTELARLLGRARAALGARDAGDVAA